MKSPLSIDFNSRPQRARPVNIAAVLLAASACGAAFLDYRTTAADADDLSLQVGKARHGVERRTDRPAVAAQDKLTPNVIAATNRAIAALNLPWREILEVFEAKTLANVALLALEPDSQKRLLRITAEAKAPEDMADFLEMLAAEPRFPEVTLTRHEINEQDPNRPIRFTMEARWVKEE